MPKGKDRTVALKTGLTILLAACFCLVEHLCLSSRTLEAVKSSNWQTHLVGQLLHANLFHLLANVHVLWLLRFSPRELLAAYLLSIPATFVVWTAPAIGFSSVLYALMGMQLPQARMPKAGWAVFIAANTATTFVPDIAFGAHCAAFALGYSYQTINTLYHDYRRACTRKRKAE